MVWSWEAPGGGRLEVTRPGEYTEASQPGLAQGLLPLNPGDQLLLKTAMECAESWHLQMTNF